MSEEIKHGPSLMTIDEFYDLVEGRTESDIEPIQMTWDHELTTAENIEILEDLEPDADGYQGGWNLNAVKLANAFDDVIMGTSSHQVKSWQGGLNVRTIQIPTSNRKARRQAQKQARKQNRNK